MKLFTIGIFSCILMLACQSKKANTNDIDSINDSIIIGLLPTTDCLPFYIAQDLGYFDSCQFHVILKDFNSQMDIDESLSENKIHIGTGDLLRTMLLQDKGERVQFLLTSSRKWQLITNKKLRIRHTTQLNDRMVGVARQSIPEYYCDEINNTIKKKTGQLLCPQINDVKIRLQMLYDNQLDAAILPEPMASIAEKQGHTSLPQITEHLHWAGFSVHSQWAKLHKKEIKQIILSYNKAVDYLNKNTTYEAPIRYTNLFSTDSIQQIINRQKNLSHLKEVEEKDISKALKWMKDKKYVRSSYVADTICLTLH